MRHLVMPTVIAFSALLTVTPATAKTTTIDKLPHTGAVTLLGTVQRIKTPQEFVLRDNSGSVNVKLPRDSELNEGDSVSITGTVDHDRTNIHAQTLVIESRDGA
jgi:uncharacterized protein YdeI (BOF family)